jgi:hypothetical protein
LKSSNIFRAEKAVEVLAERKEDRWQIESVAKNFGLVEDKWRSSTHLSATLCGHRSSPTPRSKNEINDDETAGAICPEGRMRDDPDRVSCTTKPEAEKLMDPASALFRQLLLAAHNRQMNVRLVFTK